GLSDTTALLPTIGSYKTGGKKAVFRLATAANILTRFWNPSETVDEAWSVHLDERWLNDPIAYEFPSWALDDVTVLERGQTRYVYQLRQEPIGGRPWYHEPGDMGRIAEDIQRTYTLFLIRNPQVQIYFQDLNARLEPLRDLYEFSGTNTDSTNIQPQQ